MKVVVNRKACRAEFRARTVGTRFLVAPFPAVVLVPVGVHYLHKVMCVTDTLT